MKITKRQLRRIIKEEKARLTEQPDIPDVMGAMGGGKFQPRQNDPREGELDSDMQELLQILDTAALKAEEIEKKVDDVEYSQWAGGREADDLQLALIKVWRRFGMKGEDL